MKFLYCNFFIFSMVQRTPYSIMYVWAAFEAKSPPTCQDLVTLIDNYTLYARPIESRPSTHKRPVRPKKSLVCMTIDHGWSYEVSNEVGSNEWARIQSSWPKQPSRPKRPMTNFKCTKDSKNIMILTPSLVPYFSLSYVVSNLGQSHLLTEQYWLLPWIVQIKIKCIFSPFFVWICTDLH